MTFEEFESLAAPGKIIPVFRKLNADFITPVAAYLKMRVAGSYSFLLESVEKGEQLGRYSFIGQNPFKVITVNQPETIIKAANSNSRSREDFFQILRLQLGQFRSVPVEGLPRFTCGMVGFLGYEMIHYLEDLPPAKADPVGSDDAALAFYHNLIAFDHIKNEVILLANVFVEKDSHLPQLYKDARNRLEQMIDQLNRPIPKQLPFKLNSKKPQSNFKKSEFERAVAAAKEYIYAGDIFQVVLSQRFNTPFAGDPFFVYRSLRNINPSPYMFYLDMVDYQLIGSSPEPLIRANDSELEIIPIAGTRPRGSTNQEDEDLARSLLQDPKEMAEHVMLVDLARNDLGRVSQSGSVAVSRFQTIERYSHVMHIISQVNSRLKPDCTAIEAFKAAFPAGTVSGAPKIRAMEIINELEPQKRGVYAGAIGYFDYCGNMDFCIAIRMLIARQRQLYFQAGAGIVADSIPAREYEETINKSAALQRAIKQAAEGIHDFVYR